jgi:hypothetical protein
MQVPTRTTVPGGEGAEWCDRSQIRTVGVKGGGVHRKDCRINRKGTSNRSNDQRINVYAGAKEDDYLVDEELHAVIVEESKKGEKEQEEAEASVLWSWNRLTDYNKQEFIFM